MIVHYIWFYICGHDFHINIEFFLLPVPETGRVADSVFPVLVDNLFNE